MVPTSFDEANDVLGRPFEMTDDQCGPLSILRTADGNGLPHVISCWKCTREELEEINRTSRVWLSIIGETMPPAAVCGTPPFIMTPAAP